MSSEESDAGKLAASWERPYIMSPKETKVPTPWQPKTGKYSTNSEILFI